MVNTVTSDKDDSQYSPLCQIIMMVHMYSYYSGFNLMSKKIQKFSSIVIMGFKTLPQSTICE